MGYENTVDFIIEFPTKQEAERMYEAIIDEVSSYENFDPEFSESTLRVEDCVIDGFMYDYNEGGLDDLRKLCLRREAAATFKKQSDWDESPREVEFIGPGADEKRREYAKSNLMHYCKEYLKECEGNKLTTYMVKSFMSVLLEKR
jgi:hypothetical protein